MAVIGFFDSLTEAQELVTDRMIAGIIAEIIEEGQLIPRLPVMQLDAKTLIFNREETLPSADFYSIHEDIPAQAQATVAPATAELKRCIGQWDLDNFIVDTYRDPNDIRAQAISLARKGVMRTVEDKLIYGDATTYPKEFNGLHNLVATAMKLSQGPTGGAVGDALSLDNLDQLVDLVKPQPTFLLMTFAIFRRLQQVGRGVIGQYPIVGQTGSLGSDPAPTFSTYRGIPIIRSDYLSQVETITTGVYAAKTGGLTSSIFAIRTGSVEEGGLTLITGNPMFDMKEIVLEDKDANRIRVVWYITQANGSTKSIARLDGVNDVAVAA